MRMVEETQAGMPALCRCDALAERAGIRPFMPAAVGWAVCHTGNLLISRCYEVQTPTNMLMMLGVLEAQWISVSKESAVRWLWVGRWCHMCCVIEIFQLRRHVNNMLHTSSCSFVIGSWIFCKNTLAAVISMGNQTPHRTVYDCCLEIISLQG